MENFLNNKYSLDTMTKSYQYFRLKLTEKNSFYACIGLSNIEIYGIILDTNKKDEFDSEEEITSYYSKDSSDYKRRIFRRKRIHDFSEEEEEEIRPKAKPQRPGQVRRTIKKPILIFEEEEEEIK